jgi:hypothetical protein
MPTTYNAAGIPYNSHLGYNGLPPIVTPEFLPTLDLRVTSLAGVSSPLPEAVVDSMAFVADGPGSISVNVIDGTVGANLVGYKSTVDLYMNGVPVEDGRWMLRNKGWNAGTYNGTTNWTGKSLLWDRLGKTKVWDDKRYLYDARTPGYILNDLFATAQARGALGAAFTWTFNQSVDSLGNAWPTVCSFEYKTGAKYDDIVGNLIDRDDIEIGLLGNEIRAYVSGKRGVTRPALLVVGEDVTDAPQQGTTEGLASDVIVIGDEGVVVKRSNPATSTVWGREEEAVSQGGTQDIGTLSIFGDVELSNGDGERIQRTYNMVIHQDKAYLPLRDYRIHDWITVEHGQGTSMALRVKQITFKADANGWSGALVLNDRFLESELRLAKKVAGILGGATIVGSSAPAPDDVPDTGIPNAPTGLVLNFETYTDASGFTKAVLVAGWNPVVGNTDGSFANDIAEYRFVWKYSDWDDNHAQVVVATGSQVAISPIDINRDITAYVYVVDNAGNQSAKSAVVTASTGTDTTPPPQLSEPVMSSHLRTITINWDGTAFGGVELPPDFKHAEVWLSDISDVPETNLVGTLNSAGDLVVIATMYELFAQVYAKFIPVDIHGNRGPASTIGDVTVQGIVGGDIEENSVTANLIAAGAVNAGHISAGALDTARLSLGPTMNLVVDPSFNLAEWRAARLTTQWADNPTRWFFTTGFIDRNGYYLQALSNPAGYNGGRMYMTDWIQVQYGETYYAAMYLRNGQFTPNATATMFLGWEVTRVNGEIIGGGTSYAPTGTWTKRGYNLPMNDLSWARIRFYVRADDITAGDMAIDDWEVRSAVGTTAVAGPRVTITPEGFEAYDSSENQTVLVEAQTGDVTIRGQLLSGFGGKRLEINPGATYLPEIRFKPTSSESYAYINAVDGGGGATPFIGINAPDSGSPTLRAMKLVLADDSFKLGEHEKDTLINTGTAIYGEAGDGYIYFTGKMPGGVLNNRPMFQGGKFIAAANVTTLAVSKSTILGLQFPMYSLARGTTTAPFRHHLSQDATTQWTAFFEANATIGTGVQFILFRGDVL